VWTKLEGNYDGTNQISTGQLDPNINSAFDYGDFLINELKPYIDRKYRTKRAAEFTCLGGSSLGGLVTLAIGILYPRAFTRLIVMSPSTK